MSIQKIKSILEGKRSIKLFLAESDLIKIPIHVNLFEKHMEFVSAERKILEIEYEKAEQVKCEEIFKVTIFSFTYEEMKIALQIK